MNEQVCLVSLTMVKGNRFQLYCQSFSWKLFVAATATEDPSSNLFQKSKKSDKGDKKYKFAKALGARGCSLCFKPDGSGLRNSHFIPHRVLKSIGQDIPTVSSVTGQYEADASSTVSKEWTVPLLCSDCEGYFGAPSFEGSISTMSVTCRAGGQDFSCTLFGEKNSDGTLHWVNQQRNSGYPKLVSRELTEFEADVYASIIWRSLLVDAHRNGISKTNCDLADSLRYYFCNLKNGKRRGGCLPRFRVVVDIPRATHFDVTQSTPDETRLINARLTSKYWVATQQCSRSYIKMGHVWILFGKLCDSAHAMMYTDIASCAFVARELPHIYNCYLRDMKIVSQCRSAVIEIIVGMLVNADVDCRALVESLVEDMPSGRYVANAQRLKLQSLPSDKLAEIHSYWCSN